MSLADEELKKIAKKFIKKVDPGLADQEPTVRDRQRSIPRVVERKLGLEHPKIVPSNVKVFTFRKTVIAEDGAKIPIISIITIDENGNIIKAVKSR